MPSSFKKDPDSVLDYTVDWTAWLAGDTITTSTWIVDTGLTKNSDTHTATSTTVWLSGGTLGAFYSAVNRVVTAGGRTEDRTLTFAIRQM